MATRSHTAKEAPTLTTRQQRYTAMQQALQQPDPNGGHTPECEGSCHPTCSIGQARKADATRRAQAAQAAWAAQEAAHAFRPIPGNAVFCADCPEGDSVAARGNARHLPAEHDVDINTAVRALRRVPTETLYAVLKSRNLTHGTHNALRSYADPATCTVCGQPMADVLPLP